MGHVFVTLAGVRTIGYGLTREAKLETVEAGPIQGAGAERMSHGMNKESGLWIRLGCDALRLFADVAKANGAKL